jgi:methyl-accepting chemotaxis protein
LPLGFRARLPLGFQVLFGIGCLMLLLAVCVLATVFLVLDLREDQARLNDHHGPYASAIAAAALNEKAIANDERGFLMSGDSRFTDDVDRHARATRAAFVSAASVALGGAQRQAVSEARTGFERWLGALRGEFRTLWDGDYDQMVQAALRSDRVVRTVYERSLARAQALAASAIQSGKTEVNSESSWSVTAALAGLIAALVLGLGIASWTMRTILKPVYALLTMLGDADKEHTRP